MVECPGMVVLIAGSRSSVCGPRPSPRASLTSLSYDLCHVCLVHVCAWLGKVCVSLDQNWRIQWVCSGKQD